MKMDDKRFENVIKLRDFDRDRLHRKGISIEDRDELSRYIQKFSKLYRYFSSENMNLFDDNMLSNSDNRARSVLENIKKITPDNIVDAGESVSNVAVKKVIEYIQNILSEELITLGPVVVILGGDDDTLRRVAGEELGRLRKAETDISSNLQTQHEKNIAEIEGKAVEAIAKIGGFPDTFSATAVKATNKFNVSVDETNASLKIEYDKYTKITEVMYEKHEKKMKEKHTSINHSIDARYSIKAQLAVVEGSWSFSKAVIWWLKLLGSVCAVIGVFFSVWSFLLLGEIMGESNVPSIALVKVFTSFLTGVVFLVFGVKSIISALDMYMTVENKGALLYAAEKLEEINAATQDPDVASMLHAVTLELVQPLSLRKKKHEGDLSIDSLDKILGVAEKIKKAAKAE